MLLPIAASFVFVTDAHGVKVEMAKDTHDIEVKAEGDFNAPPDKVIAAMTDYAKAPSWQKTLSESRIIDKQANSLDVYQKLKMPVISDRDYTLHVTWGDEAGGMFMKFTTSDKGPPVPHGVVRMPEHEGTWHLTKTATGSHATYEVKMDLGGSVPMGMARKNVAKSIPDFFEGLRGQLK